jgi:hypothetical protein
MLAPIVRKRWPPLDLELAPEPSRAALLRVPLEGCVLEVEMKPVRSDVLAVLVDGWHRESDLGEEEGRGVLSTPRLREGLRLLGHRLETNYPIHKYVFEARRSIQTAWAALPVSQRGASCPCLIETLRRSAANPRNGYRIGSAGLVFRREGQPFPPAR